MTKEKPFIEIEPESHFSIDNLPFGIFEHPSAGESRCAAAIGKYLVDLHELESHGLFDSTILKGQRAFSFSTLDLFLSLGNKAWKAASVRIEELLTGEDPVLKQNPRLREKVFHLREDVRMLLPVRAGNIIHSLNSTYFLEKQENNTGWMKQYGPLLEQMPVLRSGHTSSLCISGTRLRRPAGPRVLPGEQKLTISPSRMIDFELCLVFVTGKGTVRNMTMTTRKAGESIFGYMLALNVIARDFVTGDTTFAGQKIATVLSPWIVTDSALNSLRTKNDEINNLMRHLQTNNDYRFDLELELNLKPEDAPDPYKLSSTNLKYLRWNPVQELAHYSVSGNRTETGDLFISGPVSGPSQAAASLMELSDSGKHVIIASDGQERNSIQDGDTIVASGYGIADNKRIGFGEVSFTLESLF
jgi:fumarylacetoacetase